MNNQFDKTSSDGAHEARNVRKLMFIGVLAGVVLVAGVGGWAAVTEISGAVIAPGHLKVETNAKLVQHAEGGIVGQIRVREGDVVKSGDVLVILDAASTKAQLATIRARLSELKLRRARLHAERSGKTQIDLTPEMTSANNQSEIANQQKLLQSRQASHQSKLDQVVRRSEQLQAEVGELDSQTKSKQAEIASLDDDLKRLTQLDKKRLVRKSKLSELHRQLSRAQGETSRIAASASRSKGEIAQMALKAEEIKSDYRSAVLKELNQVQVEIAQLNEQETAAHDQMRRVEIRAPRNGRVHELAVHTKGGVIAAGATIMQIVPNNEGLVVEARAAPQDIDQVRQGMPATVRFTAFSSRTTPELKGKAVSVSADRSVDKQTGQPYFTVVVRIDQPELARLKGQKLIPGMPAEVLLETEPRTVLSYLIKPIADQFRLSFREQ